MKFYINGTKFDSCCARFTEILRDMDQFAEDIDSFNSALKFQLSNRDLISKRLLRASEQINKEKTGIKALEKGLNTILSEYIRTEKIVAQMADAKSDLPQRGQGKSEHSLSDSFADVLGVIPEEEIKRIFPPSIAGLISGFSLTGFIPIIPEAWVREIVSKIQDILYECYVDGFQDEDTRKLIEENREYGEHMKKAYDKADGKAKEILNKYNKDVKIAEMKNGNGNSYKASDGSFHLNAKDALNDPRTAEKVFYHEYGHYIVDQNKWVYYDANGNAHESASFKKFHQTLDREAKAYIADVEKRAWEELNAKYRGKLTEEQLRSKVAEKTVEIMKRDLGNSPSYKTNGVSDIIHAASDRKYNLGYGHFKEENGVSYWDLNWTRQGNEGFAQFFTADVNHNSVEMEFMKKHFPDAYKEYENLLDEALG